MATYLKTLEHGTKKYHVSHNGEALYYSTSNKTGGSLIKGVKFKRNQICLTKTGQEISTYDLCQLISR